MTRRYLVTGRVQGVGFRYFVLRRAQTAGVTGWVRNLVTGQVEVVATGTEQQQQELEETLWRGPRFSNVTNVEKHEVSDEPKRSTDFHIID